MLVAGVEVAEEVVPSEAFPHPTASAAAMQSVQIMGSAGVKVQRLL